MAPGTLINRVADSLRRQIATAEPGSRLPSEEDLQEQHGVSRGTVRSALKVLIGEGLIESRGSRGYYTRADQPYEYWPDDFEHALRRKDTAESGADAWAASVRAQGRTPRQEVEVAMIPPPVKVVQRLDTQPGELVVVRRRLRWVDDRPTMTADSYYPRDVADGTAIMQAGDVIIPGGLMRAAGHPQAYFIDEDNPRPPTPEESALLELSPGTAVLESIRIGYNHDDRPVRVIITIAPGGRVVTKRRVQAE